MDTEVSSAKKARQWLGHWLCIDKCAMLNQITFILIRIDAKMQQNLGCTDEKKAGMTGLEAKARGVLI